MTEDVAPWAVTYTCHYCKEDFTFTAQNMLSGCWSWILDPLNSYKQIYICTKCYCEGVFKYETPKTT